MIELTPRAAEILRRAHAAAARFNPEVAIRVVRRGQAVEFVLAEGAEDGDATVEGQGYQLFVQEGLEGVVAVVEPHDRLILRPPGSDPLPDEVLEADGH
ncbi:MAG TPA: hypothetical protein VGB28_02610 [Actinomycetota bacterium]|jgi:hypothetical protein